MARFYGGRLDLSESIDELMALGLFRGNRAAARNKALAVLDESPMFSYQTDMIYELRQ